MLESVVLATTNKGKVAEIQSLLPSWQFFPRPHGMDDIPETADTFEGNARIKAVALADATGMSALADDSGLEVDALNGDPGVLSARYAGPDATDADNIHKLLVELKDVSDEDRTARFRSAIVLRFANGQEVVAHGQVEGRIAHEPKGSNGFGYDPVFIPDAAPNRTFAELMSSEKNRISHRAAALSDLVRQLKGEQ